MKNRFLNLFSRISLDSIRLLLEGQSLETSKPESPSCFVPEAETQNDLDVSSKVKLDAILLDDDPLTRMSWKLVAKKNGKAFLAFADSQELMSQITRFDLSTPIYIDSSLGESVKGEEVAKELHRLGFQELYLATGYNRDQFGEDLSFLCGVVGKDPPW